MGCPKLSYYTESEYLKVSFKKELTLKNSVQKDYRANALKNHLGNVLAVVTDRKLVKPYVNSAFDGFESDVVSYSSYYPFGMEIKALSANNSDYRYGFNNMEKDDEVKGSGNHYDFGNRSYDSRLGRFMSLDALASTYPNMSPYAFAVNCPIRFIDINGDFASDPPSIIAEIDAVASALIRNWNGAREKMLKQNRIIPGTHPMVPKVLTAKDEAVMYKMATEAVFKKYEIDKYIPYLEYIGGVAALKKIGGKALREMLKKASKMKPKTAKKYLEDIFKKKNVKKVQSKVTIGRSNYEGEVNKLKEIGESLLKKGASKESVARTLHAKRRALGVKYKDLTPPDLLKTIYERNMKKYGDKLGPTIDYLRKQGKSWDDIISTSSKPGGKDIKFKTGTGN